MNEKLIEEMKAEFIRMNKTNSSALFDLKKVRAGMKKISKIHDEFSEAKDEKYAPVMAELKKLISADADDEKIILTFMGSANDEIVALQKMLKSLGIDTAALLTPPPVLAGDTDSASTLAGDEGSEVLEAEKV